MYWNEFVAIFDQKRKRGGRSPTQMYNILSGEIRLSPATLASFYRHQKVPRVTTMDILIPWIEREGKRVVRFGGNNGSGSRTRFSDNSENENDNNDSDNDSSSNSGDAN